MRINSQESTAISFTKPLNQVDIMALLTDSISYILNNFKSLGLSRSTKTHDYFNSLNTAQGKDEYIEKTESFWHAIGSFSVILQEIDRAINELQDIRNEHDAVIKKEGRTNLGEHFPEMLNTVRFYSHSFANSIHKFLSLCKDHKLVDDSQIIINLSELQYLRLLRNQFVQHPNSAYPIDIFSDVSFIDNSKDFLPFNWIGPGGSGWAFITSYHRTKVVDPNFFALTTEEQWKINREDFIKIGGWSKAHKNPDLVARLKSSGLPQINQKVVAEELQSLFDSKVLPYLKSKISQAESDSIIFK